jgi:hypothetical protein
LRSADARKLSLIVVAAVAARVFALWVGRADFTGWLNHTYYYFVQVRGLLEQGRLPYPDMPLLFHLYALLARCLQAAGFEADAAIVASTRVVMCVVPALIAVVVYFVVRELNGVEPLRGAQWALVGASAFLPLTIGYLPEFLQKNMLGLLLLSVVVLGSQRLLRRFRWSTSAATALVAALIVVSHFGTFAALALYGVALFLAAALVDREPRRIAVSALCLVTAGAAGMALVYALEAQRFSRLLVYAGQSLRESLLAAVVFGGRGRADALLSLAGILLFYGLLYAAYRVYLHCRSRLDAGERIFWLASLLFTGLLISPLLDEHLMGRLALFATENLELFELREPPAQWLFGADGRWLGVRRRAEP